MWVFSASSAVNQTTANLSVSTSPDAAPTEKTPTTPGASSQLPVGKFPIPSGCHHGQTTRGRLNRSNRRTKQHLESPKIIKKGTFLPLFTENGSGSYRRQRILYTKLTWHEAPQRPSVVRSVRKTRRDEADPRACCPTTSKSSQRVRIFDHGFRRVMTTLLHSTSVWRRPISDFGFRILDWSHPEWIRQPKKPACSFLSQLFRLLDPVDVNNPKSKSSHKTKTRRQG